MKRTIYVSMVMSIFLMYLCGCNTTSDIGKKYFDSAEIAVNRFYDDEDPGFSFQDLFLIEDEDNDITYLTIVFTMFSSSSDEKITKEYLYILTYQTGTIIVSFETSTAEDYYPIYYSRYIELLAQDTTQYDYSTEDIDKMID